MRAKRAASWDVEIAPPPLRLRCAGQTLVPPARQPSASSLASRSACKANLDPCSLARCAPGFLALAKPAGDMRALALSLTLCSLQLWTLVLGGPQQQSFVVRDKGWWSLSKIKSFAWENCGPPSEPAVIKSLSLSPDPIEIPGDVTVAASATTTTSFTAPLKAVVTLEKRLGDIWIKIPCVDQLGSCTYDDLCALVDVLIPPGQPCPQIFQTYELPCRCPIKAGTYNLPSSEFFIPNMDLPSFLTKGDYRIKVVLSNGDQELACGKVSMSLHSQNQWL